MIISDSGGGGGGGEGVLSPKNRVGCVTYYRLKHAILPYPNSHLIQHSVPFVQYFRFIYLHVLAV